MEIDKQWTNCKQAILQTAEACLGLDSRKKNRGWFDSECAAITNRKNAAYRMALQKHKTRNARSIQEIKERRETDPGEKRENGKPTTSKK